MSHDPSHGYEAIAEKFINARGRSGEAVVRAWAASLASGAAVLDLGAGSGIPITQILVDTGLDVSAIDASPSLLSFLEHTLPGVRTACDDARKSDFFGDQFDAILSVGLVFLLPAHDQPTLIKQMATALKPNGQLLFSAPWQSGGWHDILTGQPSHSLGRDSYLVALQNAGLTLTAEHEDEGGNHYYQAVKR